MSDDSERLRGGGKGKSGLDGRTAENYKNLGDGSKFHVTSPKTEASGRPLQPSGVNNVLYNIVNAYNKKEKAEATREHRKPEYLPTISAHILRHTGCTRMAESGVDPKVLQYIMGHANIAVTMEVYNHITEFGRIEKEILKMEDLKVV